MVEYLLMGWCGLYFLGGNGREECGMKFHIVAPGGTFFDFCLSAIYTYKELGHSKFDEKCSACLSDYLLMSYLSDLIFSAKCTC